MSVTNPFSFRERNTEWHDMKHTRSTLDCISLSAVMNFQVVTVKLLFVKVDQLSGFRTSLSAITSLSTMFWNRYHHYADIPKDSMSHYKYIVSIVIHLFKVGQNYVTVTPFAVFLTVEQGQRTPGSQKTILKVKNADK